MSCFAPPTKLRIRGSFIGFVPEMYRSAQKRSFSSPPREQSTSNDEVRDQDASDQYLRDLITRVERLVSEFSPKDSRCDGSKSISESAEESMYEDKKHGLPLVTCPNFAEPMDELPSDFDEPIEGRAMPIRGTSLAVHEISSQRVEASRSSKAQKLMQPVGGKPPTLQRQDLKQWKNKHQGSSKKSHMAAPVPITTMMMSNLPCKIQSESLIEMLNSYGFAGTYDLLYLPGRGHHGSNMGYAFVNFDKAETASRFASVFDGKPYSEISGSNTEKIISVRQAKTQGFKKNMHVLSVSHKKPMWLEHRLSIFPLQLCSE